MPSKVGGEALGQDIVDTWAPGRTGSGFSLTAQGETPAGQNRTGDGPFSGDKLGGFWTPPRMWKTLSPEDPLQHLRSNGDHRHLRWLRGVLGDP